MRVRASRKGGKISLMSLYPGLPPKFRVGLHDSDNLTKIIPHRHAQQLVLFLYSRFSPVDNQD